MTKLKTGLIGAGVFGGFHAGKIAGSPLTEFLGVYDPDLVRAEVITEKHAVTAYTKEADLLAACDALIIACPATYHADLVERALHADCHIMVEKPLALTGERADQLVALAAAHNKVVQVGHQERFVLQAMGLFDIPEVPSAIQAVRAGPPAPDGRAGDVSVIWDLMTHDLDMTAKLMGMPERLEAVGRRAHTAHLDAAEAKLQYTDGVAELMASRCHEARERHMTLTYPSGTIAIDFLTREIQNTTPFQVRADISEQMPDPLGAADEAFFAAASGHIDSPIPGQEAARAVHLAEQIEHSALQMIGA